MYREKHSAEQQYLVINQHKGLLPFTTNIKKRIIKQDKKEYYYIKTRTSHT